ncbi:S9 family peptidase [Saccharibacillus kuerlensis]|uniref:Peptidase YuxL n=1 Tax=Saccharibacillus kuerlensis TaxID=459527 RepID=A0ABQ2L4T6_9BACL|nr:S9 family peptidase [Saccharibacillus kuerlensis]GGO03133.1 putative peptidase YuxL [Saccharibacillus kuerlensis]
MSEKRGLTAEDLYRFVWVGAPDVSKADGRIVYTERTVNEARDGYLTKIRAMNSSGENDVVFTSGEEDASPIWSPDGSFMAFARKHHDKRQIWLLPANGGEARVLTDLPNGVGSFKWSPDGMQLLVSSQVDPEASAEEQEDGTSADNSGSKDKALKETVIDRIRYKGDGSGLWNGKRNHLFVVDASSGEAAAVTSGDFDAGSFAWSPDGSKLAFTAYIPEEGDDTDPDFLLVSDLYVADADGGNLRKLSRSDWGIGQMAWSPDGSKIAFFASDRSYHNATLTRLYIIPADGGEITSLVTDPDLLVGNLVVGDMRAGLGSPDPLFSEDGSSVYALFTHHGSAGVARFAADGSGHEVLLDGDRDVYQLAPDHDGGFIVAVSDPLNPGDLYRFVPGTKEETRLTDANGAWLSEHELSEPEAFWVETKDGWKVHGWIMKPVGFHTAASDESSKVPTILEIHGGPHMMYGHTFMHEFQLLASKGYAVIFSNPRGGHGYGQEFVNACRGDYGGGDYRDLMETVDYALEHYDFIDESRLGVTGGSYGGFMTNWIVGHTDRFKAAVTQRSISNWVSFYGVSDIGFFFTEDQIGGDAWQDTDLLWKHSPIAYVQQMRTPLLILHGEQDLRCPIEQAEQLFTALKRLGRKTRLVRFPGASHDLSRGGHPSLRVARLSHIAGWMDEYL